MLSLMNNKHLRSNKELAMVFPPGIPLHFTQELVWERGQRFATDTGKAECYLGNLLEDSIVVDGSSGQSSGPTVDTTPLKRLLGSGGVRSPSVPKFHCRLCKRQQLLLFLLIHCSLYPNNQALVAKRSNSSHCLPALWWQGGQGTAAVIAAGCRIGKSPGRLGVKGKWDQPPLVWELTQTFWAGLWKGCWGKLTPKGISPVEARVEIDNIEVKRDLHTEPLWAWRVLEPPPCRLVKKK